MSTGPACLIVALVWATTPLAIKWSAEGGAPIGSVMLIALIVGALILLMRRPRPRLDRRACPAPRGCAAARLALVGCDLGLTGLGVVFADSPPLANARLR